MKGACGCITNEYMAATAVMTVRIEPELLAALKAKAKRDGRTVSAEVVQLIRKGVEPAPVRTKSARTMGMFSEFEAPELDELVELRRSFSRKLRPRAKKRP